jgi:hypothetical protein
MGRHSAGKPNETGVRPDGMEQPWQPMPPRKQQPMLPCSRCGAAFTAHLNGRCPQTHATADRVAAQQWAARMQDTGQPSASWAPPPAGPPPVPQTAGPKPPRPNWPRQHRWLTCAIVLAALLIGIGIHNEIGKQALETDPVLAKRYAENAVGSCLQNAWGNAGYPNVFDSYVSAGVVEFRTGTSDAPTGDYADDTLIDVYVYTNGTVVGMPGGAAGGPPPATDDNAALDYWGCSPGHPTAPPRQIPPPGLLHDGALRTGCVLTYSSGVPVGATITLYNPGSAPVSVNGVGVEFVSNGILVSEDSLSYQAILDPGRIANVPVTLNGAISATSCGAGWN